MTTSFRLQASGNAWQVNTASVELHAAHIAVFRVEGNLIAEQTDYVDYESISNQVNILQAQFGLSKRR